MKREKSLIMRFVPLLLILAVFTAVFATSVFARYISESEKDVTNTFTPADSVKPEVVEEFDGKTKKNVYIKVGATDYPVYVRAVIVVTWQDKDKTIHYMQPEAGEDYTLTRTSSKWTEIGGFYYYTEKVASGGQTENLIDSCAPIDGQAPNLFHLNVEIIVQTIQAVGTTDKGDDPAWKDAGWKGAWGI